MRRHTILAAVTAATLAMPAPAHADTFSGSGCGGVNFTICATWSLILDGSTYKLTFTNTANGTNAPLSTITQAALGQAVETDATFNLVSASTGWGIGDDNGSPYNGMGMLEFVFNGTTTQGINDGAGPGESVFIWFTVNDPVSGQVFDPTQIGFHAQGGPNECSAKAVFTGTTVGDGTDDALVNSIDPNCGTVIPEPATMTLLGTGLLALVAAGGVLRRRGKTE